MYFILSLKTSFKSDIQIHHFRIIGFLCQFYNSLFFINLALRNAQTMNNEAAVTYIYDLLANLAFEIGMYILNLCS